MFSEDRRMYDQIEQSISRIRQLNPDELRLFKSLLKPKSVKKKEVVLRSGQDCRQVYFINSGCLRYYYLVDGEEKSAQFFFENAAKFSEFGLNLGYRHYFWKGFHAELALYPSSAQETQNKLDGKDYRGFALTTELYTGYTFNIAKGSNYSFYLMPQVGIGYNPISNLGPQTEESSAFPTLNLQLGIRFR